jgi:glucan phosphorylase
MYTKRRFAAVRSRDIPPARRAFVRPAAATPRTDPDLGTAMAQLDAVIPRTRIAYFSMEIALPPEMHTYSGGLGVLAGDTARSCADHRDRAGWIWMMKEAISKIAYYFNSQRMMRRYASEAYIR